MKLAFIGSGYVGLTTGILMSYLGHQVTCLDNNEAKIAQLNQGILPIYELMLDHYLRQSQKEKNIIFTDKYDDSLREVKAVFITVGTPPLPSGEADLQYIIKAIDELVNWISQDCVIIIKSTVPPGTANYIRKYLQAKNYFFAIASNPEFLREGTAVGDFLDADRVIIGSDDNKTVELCDKIYEPLKARGVKLLHTDSVTAELIKYSSNAFLAIKIAFINELANFSEKIGADIKALSTGIGLDRRIGDKFLNAGPGFGGSCFPKDILALAATMKKHETTSLILESVIAANQKRPEDMVNKVAEIIGDLKNKKLAILGLTFKAGTDDLRGSPAIKIIEILLERGSVVSTYDPAGMSKVDDPKLKLTCKNSISEVCRDSEAIVITTEWPEFKKINFAEVLKIVRNPVIIDLRNMFNKDYFNNSGFEYYSIGRKHDA